MKSWMMIFLKIALIFICLKGCSQDNSEFVKFYKTIQSKIPIVEANNNFALSIESLEKISFLMNKGVLLETDFFDRYLSNIDEFRAYRKEYQTLIFSYILELHDGYYRIIITQKIHNNIEANAYLVTFKETGEVTSVFLLAKMEASPIDFFVIKSNFLSEDLIEVVKLHSVSDIDETFKDSVVTVFRINQNFYFKQKVDSVRLFRP